MITLIVFTMIVLLTAMDIIYYILCFIFYLNASIFFSFCCEHKLERVILRILLNCIQYFVIVHLSYFNWFKALIIIIFIYV